MAIYKLNGNDLSSIGFAIKEVRGNYTIPPRKKPIDQDKLVSSGIVPLIGSNDYFMDSREIEVECFLIASSVSDAIGKMNQLKALLYAPGTITLNIDYSNEEWICYCRDGAKANRLNKVIDNPVYYNVLIKLVEINPRRT